MSTEGTPVVVPVSFEEAVAAGDALLRQGASRPYLSLSDWVKAENQRRKDALAAFEAEPVTIAGVLLERGRLYHLTIREEGYHRVKESRKLLRRVPPPHDLRGHELPVAGAACPECRAEVSALGGRDHSGHGCLSTPGDRLSSNDRGCRDRRGPEGHREPRPGARSSVVDR